MAVAWLREEDWPRWQAVDPGLPAHTRWLEKINAAIRQSEDAGFDAVKIVIQPDAFIQWCKAAGKPGDRNSRAEFAARQLMTRLTAH